jgi:pimeloyl-[acyl-carrier protein] methyl ester esterase
MPLTLLFMHGWAFDASLWRDLSPRLADFRCVAADRGYFGEPVVPETDGPVIVVAHSLGAMLALASPPGDCRGLIAVNGFDRFVAGPDSPGVAGRIVERMLDRLPAEPEQVVRDFRRRCREAEAFGLADVQRLKADLAFLRNGDCRGQTAAAPFPILSLQGADDPILPLALRDAAFKRAPHLQYAVCPDGGHLLPLSHADWCAEKIAEFARALV